MGLTSNISGIYEHCLVLFSTSKYSLAYSLSDCTLISMCANKVPSPYGKLSSILAWPPWMLLISVCKCDLAS